MPSEKYPDPPKTVSYGTAGFRDVATALPTVLYRVGLLAALRSRYLEGKTVGVMITASHNPPGDNGAKLVDPLGEMLEQSWEIHASNLANAQGDDEVASILSTLYKTLGVDREASSRVLYGYDTRASGPGLIAALEDGLRDAGAELAPVGIVTTPQLHYLVRAFNTLRLPGYDSYGVPTEEGYYKKLATAFAKILSIHPNAVAVSSSLPIEVTVDCANGVGGPKLAAMARYFAKSVRFNILNADTDHPERLNKDCGADYVKTNQGPPKGVNLEPGKLYASFDGDADRVVFYHATQSGEFHLLDGDRIAGLTASFLGGLIKNAGAKFKIGVVQTAYANGASTRYVADELGLPVVCTPTGVKHLHHAALDFGIGIYFEANGHGTVLFDPETVARLRTLDVSTSKEKDAIDTLLALSDLINQTVGDAISDLLMVLAFVAIRRWTPDDWYATYKELPNRLLKASVRDRTMFTTTDAERRLVEPAGVQKQLDILMDKYPQARTFVRASGTEDVVRIYAEAATQEHADALANDVVQILAQFQ